MLHKFRHVFKHAKTWLLVSPSGKSKPNKVVDLLIHRHYGRTYREGRMYCESSSDDLNKHYFGTRYLDTRKRSAGNAWKNNALISLDIDEAKELKTILEFAIKDWEESHDSQDSSA